MKKGTTFCLKGTELQFWFGSQLAKKISQYRSNFSWCLQMIDSA